MNQYEEEINEKYLCSICQGLFLNPKIIITCKHSFCTNCLDSLIRNENSPTCPLCRKQFFKKNIKINTDLVKEINSQKIKCKCKNIVNLNAYEEHVSTCVSFNSDLKSNIKSMVIKDSKVICNRILGNS